MGKVSKCIQMLQILNSHSIVGANELAQMLDINKRNISEYKKELEDAGYVINTQMGRNGGYYLDKTQLVPPLKFTLAEKETLEDVCEYINKRYDFLNKKDFNLAMGKIFSVFTLLKTEDEMLIIDRYPLSMDNLELQHRYEVLQKGINEKKKVKIEYSSLKNTTKTHIVHPYSLFIYNNCWFFIGYNETIGDIGYFKLNRIVDLNLLSHRFTKKESFDLYDYVDNFGMKNNGLYYDVKLKVKNESKKVISERIYGRNQKIEECDDQSIILSCQMQNKMMIISFVLGFLTDMEVIEPSWLKDEVRKNALSIANQYKD